jgi:hypothetical protein
MIGGLPADLLGGHVADRAHDDAGSRLDRGGRRRHLRRRGSGGGLELRQAEVEDLHAAVVRDEEVLGLQVAVDDPLLVGRREPLRDLARVVDRLPRRERAAGKLLSKRLALEQLLDDVRRAVVGAGVVDREDVRVVELPRSHAPLARNA